MSSSARERQFEEYLRDGISAAKSGDRRMAQLLLNRALMLNSGDARPYLWLSSTTDEPVEQREYLEKAVALDPNNTAARRGLAMLTGKIDKARLMPQGAGIIPTQPVPELDADGKAFQCPQCGGRLSFSVRINRLACEYCGHEQADVLTDEPAKTGSNLASIADSAEQVMDWVMPTSRGHRWAEAQHQLHCERCGALSVLPPTYKTLQCPYCGSNQLVESPEHAELIDPQVIALMKLDQKEANQRVRAWLGRGLFTPDNILLASQRVTLRPAYYSCWTFDGTIEMRWSCEVQVGGRRSMRWEPRSGSEVEFFNDVLVSGVKALAARELESIEPFDLHDVQEFTPEYFAGWPALLYDSPLSEASLQGREKVVKNMRVRMSNTIEVGREKRNLNIWGSQWSGMTFKHILLPVWVGTYHFQGKEFHLLVNGQTGKVGGKKPRDTVKLVFAILTTLIFLFLLFLLYWLLIKNQLPF